MADDDTGSGGSVFSRFGDKAGPLPIWAWAVLVVAVGYLGYHYFSKKKSGSSSSTDTADTTADDADIASGIIGADYDLRNSLNATNSNIATLGSGINANTEALEAETKADKDDEPKRHNYAVLSYGGHDYEVGAVSGTEISKAEEKKTRVKQPEKTGKYIHLKWAPKNYYQLGQQIPKHLTEEEFHKIKGHPKATVVTMNTHVNVAPSKVR